MRTRLRIFIIAVIAFGLVCVSIVICSSLRRSEAAITRKLERLTPLGTQYAIAAHELESHFGRIQKNKTTGFLRQEGPRQEVVGAMSIEIHLDDYYHFPIGTTLVDALWGFDKEGKLLEIWVWKTTDSL